MGRQSKPITVLLLSEDSHLGSRLDTILQHFDSRYIQVSSFEGLHTYVEKNIKDVDIIVIRGFPNDAQSIFDYVAGFGLFAPLCIQIADSPNRKADFSVATSEEQFFIENNLPIILKLVSLNRINTKPDSQIIEGTDLLRDSIVQSVAHELRTPLLQIKSAVSLLAEENNTSKRIIELAMEATSRLENGVRNVTLLNDLMHESFQEQLLFTDVFLSEVIETAVRKLTRMWQHKNAGQRIGRHIPSNLPMVWGDKQQLSIVLQLLLDNALKFSEKTVDISAEQRDGMVFVAIRDEGIGISSDQIPHIFEPFYQVDGSTTRRYGGIGVGLAITRFILKRHNSTVHVFSRLGEGSTFSFTLPTTRA